MDSDAIISAVTGVTKTWTKQRKAEERSRAAEANRRSRMTLRYRDTIKDVAYRCMEEAYLETKSSRWRRWRLLLDVHHARGRLPSFEQSEGNRFRHRFSISQSPPPRALSGK